MTGLRRVLMAAAALAFAAGLARTADPAPSYTPDQARRLAVRAAQVDAYRHLADLVLAARLPDGKTVQAALGPGSDAEVALRVFLRSARPASDVRLYSDGVAEVDLEILLDAVIQKVSQLCASQAGAAVTLDDLRAQTVDGRLWVEGHAAAPPDLSPERIKAVEAAPAEGLPDLFPVGWERVTAQGRVEAERQARVRAYAEMTGVIRTIRVNPALTIGDLAGGMPEADALLDGFIRGVPVVGPVRLMPDRIAEVDVAVAVRDLIKVLKEIRALSPADGRWTEEQADQLSVQLKTDRLVATGRAMPPLAEVRPEESLSGAPEPPVPDWAAVVLEARGTAKWSEEVEDKAEARLLAARAAKARAASALGRQVDAVRMDDGRTVRERAAKDPVFSRDVATLITSAKPVKQEGAADGKEWEVVLRLPLRRLWEFSRPREGA